MSEPRNWKWMVPAVVGLVLFVWWGTLPMEVGDWAWIPLGMALICWIGAVMNFALYYGEGWSSIVTSLWSARFQTPEVMMFEAAKGMHPEAVRLLLTQRRIVWRTRYVPQKDLVDWVLDDVPSVHVGFARFILEHSTSMALMPKRMLSENSFGFDPDGKITDRQQYDDLVKFMQAKLMVTEAFGNQAPMFVPPWKPEDLMWRFGIVNTDEVEEEGTGSEAIDQRVMAKLPKAAPLSASTQTSPQMDTFGGRGKVEEREPPELTADEAAAIAAETKRYAARLSGVGS